MRVFALQKASAARAIPVTRSALESSSGDLEPAYPVEMQPEARGEQEPVVIAPGVDGSGEEGEPDSVQHPAKVMRIATMAKQLLDEVRAAPLDEASRQRTREVYETSVKELADVLSDDLKEELARLALPFEEGTPSDAELRIAHAQLVGWLEGLFQGIQAMLFAQQMESRQRLEEMRRRSLPQTSSGAPEGEPSPGHYL